MGIGSLRVNVTGDPAILTQTASISTDSFNQRAQALDLGRLLTRQWIRAKLLSFVAVSALHATGDCDWDLDSAGVAGGGQSDVCDGLLCRVYRPCELRRASVSSHSISKSSRHLVKC